MDFVQGYYLSSLAINAVVIFWMGVFRPSGISDLNNLAKLGLWPFSVLLSLPIIGRIFGWW